MKFNVLYGKGNDEKDTVLLQTFSTLKKAEKFIYNDIKKYHQPNYYIRVNILSETERWYDYGDYVRFYFIKCVE